jgi:hypothetical protein
MIISDRFFTCLQLLGRLNSCWQNPTFLASFLSPLLTTIPPPFLALFEASPVPSVPS